MTATLHVGTTFLVCDSAGQIARGTEGLYFQDARFLSTLELLLDGHQLLGLSSLRSSPSEGVQIGTNPTLDGVTRGTLALVRRRRLAEDALVDEIAIENYGDHVATFQLEIKLAADFESIFQIKGGGQTGRHGTAGDVRSSRSDDGRHWSFQRRAHGKMLETEIEFSSGADAQSDGGAGFSVTVARHGTWKVTVQVRMRIDDGAASSRKRGPADPKAILEHKTRLSAAAPTLETDHPVLGPAYRRATHDLVDLRIKAAESEGYEIAAGIPWYMALFGRDSLIASYQTMLHDPSLARGTLRALSNLQGERENRDTLEEPGRILHEYRSGIATSAQRKIPRFPYYGTIDATPLFLIVVSEYVRVTGDLDFVRTIWGNVERALRWVTDASDRDGDGLISYDPGPDGWLQNLGWKDSGDSVRFRDGTIAHPSIALVEVQGYAVDAFRRVAELLDAFGKPGAGDLRKRADRLARAIDGRFWMEDRAYFAEAVDGSRKRVDALTSNPGHLLWAGVIERQRAVRMAEVLLSAELFSGFGVRTMGTAEGGYNPLSYHNGSVWPHDNSLILDGLARFQMDDHVRKLAEAMLAALSSYPDHRWPELFDGYDRSNFAQPIAYPDANSPQAWATGAVVLLVRALLGISVDAIRHTVTLHPVAVEGASFLRLRGVPVGGVRVDIEARFGERSPEVSVSGLPQGWTWQHAARSS